ncbi:MAG: squalene/phytoene synthase family protein [Thermoguttaceae bacterium]|jgi:phytoene synthase|nr:squalene/phytoene synthase family protein [Thermoguttaceae bacterium]
MACAPNPFADPVIHASYARCREIARRAGSSFYPSFFLLPRSKRRAMEALYAFMRHSDDLADGPQPLEHRRQALAEWRGLVEAVLPSGMRASGTAPVLGEAATVGLSDVLLLPALADTVRRFGIPPEHLLAVLDGLAMDLDVRAYATFDELQGYCRLVGSAPGLVCLYVWGFSGDDALDLAGRCGVAFQLTNILRDLGQDAAGGRVYLPESDLRECGYTRDDLLCGVVNEPFERLVLLEGSRARSLYHEGADLIDRLARDGRRMFGMMTSLYHHLLDEVLRRRRELFVRRIRLGAWSKLRIAARWALLPPRRSSLP